VLSSRPVEISGDEGSAAGPLAGGAIGGATGLTIGSGSGSLLAAVIGVVIGAGIGYFAENELSGGDGIEYIVELEDGRVVTLVQNTGDDETPISDGEPVLIQFGNEYTRITRLETDIPASSGGGASGWANPDTPPGASDEGAQGASEPSATPESVLPSNEQDQGQQE